MPDTSVAGDLVERLYNAISDRDALGWRDLAEAGETIISLRTQLAAAERAMVATAKARAADQARLATAMKALEAGEKAWQALMGRIGYAEYQKLEDEAVRLRTEFIRSLTDGAK